ncbi:hypothetical protein QQF64_019436, partial [Cirrhinus molitorella]
LIEENKEIKELIEEGENHHVKTEETSSLKQKDKIWPQCEKSLSCEQNLDIHIKCHLEGKLYTCDQGEKAFTIKGNLTKHMNIHTEEKPYTWSVSFRLKGILKRHMNIHSGQKLYSCNQCEESLNNYNCFKKHLLTHSRERLENSNQSSRKSSREKFQEEKQPYHCHLGRDSLNYLLYFLINYMSACLKLHRHRLKLGQDPLVSRFDAQ